jgi:hypothetical protein
VRLLTYESAEEAKVLTSIFLGRTGDLENTTFCLLASDGKTKISRPGRTPDHAFRNADEMAAAMAKAAKGAKPEEGVRKIPYLVDLRRAINAASCDIQPLVVVVAKDDAAREKIESTLAPLAWDKEFIGRFAYARAAEATSIEGAPKGDGVLVVQPDTYGLKAKLLASDVGVDAASLAKALKAGADAFVPAAKDSMKHIESCRRQGIHWETAIPVTEPAPREGPPK